MMKLARSAFSPRVLSHQLISLCAVVLCLGVALLGCRKVEREDIGNRIDSPVALATHPTLSVSYVLNAVLGGEYETGSLQAYSVASDTKPRLLRSEKVPRLGTAVAVAKDGSFLMAGFSGSVSEIQVFDLDASGIPTKSSSTSHVVKLTEGRIGTLHLVQLAGQQDWLVVASVGDRTFDAKVFVYRFSKQTGFQKLLSTPDDLYTANREGALGAYTLAWGSPVVFESLGLMVAFPSGSLGYLGVNPSALDWLAGRAASKSESYDLRTVSALVVDLRRLLTNAIPENSVGYFPIAFNQNGASGNTGADSSAPENSSFAFRTAYQSSIALDATGSSCQPNAPVTALAPATAVVATNNASVDVIALKGFDVAAGQLRTRLEQGENQPVFGNVLVPQPVALTSQIPTLADIRTLIPQFQLIKVNTLCTLSWLRVEQRRSSLGAEKSRIQIATAVSAAEQAELESPLLGMASFVVNGSNLLGGSFGTNQIQQFKFDGSKIYAGDVFQ